jgi:predicted KAP-like P-loop ATPase
MICIDDRPAAKVLFDFDRLARSLVQVLEQPREAAFVLGLHGPWGSGKTTVLNALRGQLAAGSAVVEFNAWKYVGHESLSRALVLTMLGQLRKLAGDDPELDELERSLYEAFTVTEQGPLKVNWGAAVTEAALLSISLVSMGIGGSVVKRVAEAVTSFFGVGRDKEKSEDVAKRVDRVSGILQRQSTQRAVRKVTNLEQFETLFRELVARLAVKGRIYVLIDDLDRCLPDAALEVFEAVKLYLDAPQCVYVVATDRAVIRRGLTLRS